MKTILKQLLFSSILLATIAGSAAIASAQTADPCEGAGAVYEEFNVAFPKKDRPGRVVAIEKGKQFIEKFGSCADWKDQVDFIKTNLPIMEGNLKKYDDTELKKVQLAKFNAGLTAKKWDDVYSSGKALLEKYPDELRDAKLVLGSIGLDETLATPSVTKWNDETLKYAKESLADLESGKTFKTFGVAPLNYKNKEDAMGWMNYTIGYILAFDKKDKKEGAAYMHKAAQSASSANANPGIYTASAQYYVELLNAEILKLKGMPAVDPADTDEVKKQKDEDLKKQAAIMKGTADRALDAFARAYVKAPSTPTSKAFKDGLLKSFKDIYQIRYDKPDGADAMINTYANKPFLSPAAPIAPIADVTPAAGAATTKPATVPATKPATIPAKNPTTAPATKPATVAKPATAKPGAVVAKKKGTR